MTIIPVCLAHMNQWPYDSMNQWPYDSSHQVIDQERCLTCAQIRAHQANTVRLYGPEAE